MPAAKAYAGGASVGTNFYVVSGFNGSALDPALYGYDTTTGVWTTLAPIPTPVSQARVAALGTKIYAAGGFNAGAKDTMQIYDTGTNTWSQGAPMPAARSGAGVVAFNGKIYIIAGFDINFTETNTVYEYDPVADTYVTKASVPASEGNIAAGVLGNLIYAVGGSATFMHYAYDPATDSWATIAAGLTANFQTPGVFAIGGQLWVEGGSNGFSPYPSNQQVQIYDPGTNTWSFGPEFITSRYGSSAAAAINSRGYIAGGVDISNNVLAEVESIQPSGAPTPTVTPTIDPTAVPPTDTPTPTVDPTLVPPTDTPTLVPTDTVVPTNTAVPTDTALPATETPTVCTLSFEDVPVGSTFYPYIQCLACQGIINGYPCGGPGEPCNPANDPYFRPGNNVTRGQFAKIASNSAGFNEPPGAQQYEDVAVGSTFFDFVWRLSDRGYINGYPCGGPGEPCGSDNLPYFRPNANVTRGQLSKIDANAAGFDETPGAQQYEDVLPGSTFYDFIWRLSDRGIINGYPCGGNGEPCGPTNLPYFRPSANATRGQASKIVSSTFFPTCSVTTR
jgi:N-acetylneuraminic acid mutarotase